MRAIFILGAALPTLWSLAFSQTTYPTPEAAVKALVKAVQDGKPEATLAILGPEAKDALKDKDPDLVKLERDLFLLAAKKAVKVEKDEGNQNRAIAYFGEQEWPFPAPLIKDGQSWHFDGKEGMQEMADRAIGRHELAALGACNGYVAAQLEYSATDWDGDGFLSYADKLKSSPGKKDGLIWSNDDGGAESPLGPFFLGDVEGKGDEPLAGYRFKILTRQGADAKGGARDYMVDGKMVLGFGLVAWPDQYGKSGISTFIVNQLGDVYEKDLGQQTAESANSMQAFNPDSSWKKVDQD